MKLSIYLLCIFPLLLSFTGCSGASDESSRTAPAESAPAASVSGLADATGIDQEVIQEVREAGAGLPDLPENGGLAILSGYDEDGNDVEYDGITFPVDKDEAMDKLRELRSSLNPQGYEVFYVQMNFGFGADRLVVMRTDNRFKILEVMGTNGANYEIYNNDVVTRLRDWNSRFGIDILGASFDWALIEFKSQPADMRAFADEVYEFCPDLVDQGFESVDALADDMRNTNGVMLWWD